MITPAMTCPRIAVDGIAVWIRAARDYGRTDARRRESRRSTSFNNRNRSSSSLEYLVDNSAALSRCFIAGDLRAIETTDAVKIVPVRLSTLSPAIHFARHSRPVLDAGSAHPSFHPAALVQVLQPLLDLQRLATGQQIEMPPLSLRQRVNRTQASASSSAELTSPGKLQSTECTVSVAWRPALSLQ